MAASLGIEEESGVFTGRVHPHNGYYAGDFTVLVPQGAPPRQPVPPVAAGGRDGR